MGKLRLREASHCPREKLEPLQLCLLYFDVLTLLEDHLTFRAVVFKCWVRLHRHSQGGLLYSVTAEPQKQTFWAGKPAFVHGLLGALVIMAGQGTR